MRLAFSDMDGNQEVDETEILQQHNHYPFGLQHEGTNYGVAQQTTHKYLFNGKEIQSELDIKWMDFGARNYDASVGRWFNTDPITKHHESPYAAFAGNPLLYIDPNGMDTTFCNADLKKAFDDAYSKVQDKVADFDKRMSKVSKGAIDSEGNIDIDKMGELSEKTLEKLEKLSDKRAGWKKIEADFDYIINENTELVTFEMDASLEDPAKTTTDSHGNITIRFRDPGVSPFNDQSLVIHENRHANQIVNSIPYTLQSEVEAYNYQFIYDPGYRTKFLTDNETRELNKAVEKAYPGVNWFITYKLPY